MPYTFTTRVDGDVIYAAHINALQVAVAAIKPNNESIIFGIRDSRPAWSAGNAGTIYWATDIASMSYDDGTAWIEMVPGRSGLLTPPPSAGWTASPMGTSTITADKGGRLLTLNAAGGGDNHRMEYRTLTAAINYTATFFLEINVDDAGNQFQGIYLRNAAGNMVMFCIGHDGQTKMAVMKWTSVTAFSADYKRTLNFNGQVPNWWRFRDDGTNRYCEFSLNGTDWLTFHQVGRTDYLTPTVIGWGGMYAQGLTIKTFTRLRSFKET